MPTKLNSLQENLSKNTIIQLLIKNQECLNKSVCNRKTILGEKFKTVPKCRLEQGNNTERFRINCSNLFEVCPQQRMIMTVNQENQKSEFLTNDDVRNRKKSHKSCITNRKYKRQTLPKKINKDRPK